MVRTLRVFICMAAVSAAGACANLRLIKREQATPTTLHTACSSAIRWHLSEDVGMPVRDILVVCLGADAGAVHASLQPFGWHVVVVSSLGSARKVMLEKAFPVGLLLLADADRYAVNELDTLLELPQATEWVGIFPPQVVQQEGYRQLIVQHLYDFQVWPMDSGGLIYSLERARTYAELRGPAGSPWPVQGHAEPADSMAIVGSSQVIADLRRQIVKVAQVNAPVLIWGESGSGKELVAHAIHTHSPRAEQRFVAMNCGAVPASLIQSELFGYERGAFTGANRERRGLIESAHGGTLFLDEVGDLALELQVNLLRFLQERSIVRVGASQPIEVDVRVIAASHRCLEDAVREGRFREDLLYRLNVLPLAVPALRERKEDLDTLALHFFKLFGKDKNPRLNGFGNRAMLAMHQHDWPGNVRELINRIRRAMVMSEGRLITPGDLGLQTSLDTSLGDALEDARIRAECEAIQESLHGHGNNKTLAARDLGVSRMTLYRLMGKHGISL
jgi:DNA-binding NtrC family response regulator